jgi:solute carrier family 9 (sodium/hydrogen exchanger), member 3
MIEFSLKNIFSIVLGTICITYVKCAYETVDGGDAKTIGRYQVAQFHFEHVSDVYAITLWILLGSLAKVGFHLSKKLTEHFPESCLLILLGLVVGGLLYATKLAEQKAYVLNSDTFFIFLLPPIILEAGYFMPNRPFFDNIGTILLLAVVNTLFNTITIGFTLYAFNFTPLYGGTHFEMLHCLLFAALISAVDPVAVIATFVEIHVNDMLYIIVFGESLLNDAVSIVLYRLFDKFSEMGEENILGVDVVLGATSFFIVSIGGVLIGIIFGVIGSFTTKFTEHTPVLEPLIILTYAYLSYLTAEMFSTSGILAITFCGMFMKQYVGYNIAKKSNATIEYILKMLASIMETIIFMFMGLSTVSDHHSWNTGFVIITIVSCSLFRFIGVMIFANIANRWRLLELKLTDMLIMSYGGIRGAVAFALALILDEAKVPRKKEFVTATIAVVFFTVFIQGTTVGPIVQWLNIKRKEEEEPTMSAKLTNRLIDHVMSAFEELTGVAGKHKLRNRVRQIDRKYFKAFLLREKAIGLDQDLLTKFNQIKEMSIIKMAASNDFASFPVNSSKNDMRNMSISNFFAGG